MRFVYDETFLWNKKELFVTSMSLEWLILQAYKNFPVWSTVEVLNID